MTSLKIKNVFFSILAALIFITYSCNIGEKEEDKEKEVKAKADKPQINIPDFNQDSAYYFVKKQVEFGPRTPGSQAHKKCAAYLEKTLKRFSALVTVQKFKARVFNKEVYNGKNIIASFNPGHNNRILLCAHWDSRPIADHDPDPEKRDQPIDGANDGASGTGVLLEVARQLHINPHGIGVDIILFDLEDYGPPEGSQTKEEDYWALGSQYWSKTPHEFGYDARFGILLDMVGASNATFYKEGISYYYAKYIVDKIWSIAHEIGYDNYFINKESSAVLDDHYYINELINIPTVDIIHQNPSTSKGFFKYWHTTDDTLEKIDPATLKVVGQLVLTVIYREQET